MAFMADVGQEEVCEFSKLIFSTYSSLIHPHAQDFEAARAKALKVGAKKFVLEVCAPNLRAA